MNVIGGHEIMLIVKSKCEGKLTGNSYTYNKGVQTPLILLSVYVVNEVSCLTHPFQVVIIN